MKTEQTTEWVLDVISKADKPLTLRDVISTIYIIHQKRLTSRHVKSAIWVLVDNNQIELTNNYTFASSSKQSDMSKHDN